MNGTRTEPRWFRWLVLAAIGLGVALIVVNFLRASRP